MLRTVISNTLTHPHPQMIFVFSLYARSTVPYTNAFASINTRKEKETN
jgi:hypothetical protein